MSCLLDVSRLTSFPQQLDLVSPFQLYFNPGLIVSKYQVSAAAPCLTCHKQEHESCRELRQTFTCHHACTCLLHQVWRLLTNFLYFGPFGLSFLFNVIFTYRYCRMLEEGSFRGKAADFLFMFLFGGSLMIAIALFVNLLFLGHAFTMMLVYVWSRRNPLVRMNFFGLLNFQAPYLPWVLLAFSLLLGNPVLVVRPSTRPASSRGSSLASFPGPDWHRSRSPVLFPGRRVPATTWRLAPSAHSSLHVRLPDYIPSSLFLTLALYSKALFEYGRQEEARGERFDWNDNPAPDRDR